MIRMGRALDHELDALEQNFEFVQDYGINTMFEESFRVINHQWHVDQQINRFQKKLNPGITPQELKDRINEYKNNLLHYKETLTKIESQELDFKDFHDSIHSQIFGLRAFL